MEIEERLERILLEEIEWIESPSTLVREAVEEFEREYKRKLEENGGCDPYFTEQSYTWSKLGHQIIGHEVY
jgi:hypothetical protein